MARFLSMIAVLVALCLVCAGDAVAKGGKGGKGGKKHGGPPTFEKLDKNNDGKLSPQEFKDTIKDADRASKAFQKSDKNSDGFLSKDEFKALQDARKDHQKKK